MNKCPHCGMENQLNHVYCYNCGNQLLFPCIVCGEKHLPDLKFCPDKGNNIAQVQTRFEAKKLEGLERQKYEDEFRQKHTGRRLIFISVFIAFIFSLEAFLGGVSGFGCFFIALLLSLTLYFGIAFFWSLS